MSKSTARARPQGKLLGYMGMAIYKVTQIAGYNFVGRDEQCQDELACFSRSARSSRDPEVGLVFKPVELPNFQAQLFREGDRVDVWLVHGSTQASVRFAVGEKKPYEFKFEDLREFLLNSHLIPFGLRGEAVAGAASVTGSGQAQGFMYPSGAAAREAFTWPFGPFALAGTKLLSDVEFLQAALGPSPAILPSREILAELLR